MDSIKPTHCTLIINTRNGYCMTPTECNSVSQAVRKARESFGFAYRIFVGGRLARKGFCGRH